MMMFLLFSPPLALPLREVLRSDREGLTNSFILYFFLLCAVVFVFRADDEQRENEVKNSLKLEIWRIPSLFSFLEKNILIGRRLRLIKPKKNASERNFWEFFISFNLERISTLMFIFFRLLHISIRVPLCVRCHSRELSSEFSHILFSRFRRKLWFFFAINYEKKKNHSSVF